MAEYLIVLVVAALVTWALTPSSGGRRSASARSSPPDPRRAHDRTTPTLGGGHVRGFLAAMAVASVLPHFRPIFRGTSEPFGLLIGATVMFAVGALDDIRDVSPPAKLAGQVFSGSLLSILGVTLLFFRIPFAGFVVLSPDLSPLLTVIWVALMANAVNLIDGLDGLAAGVVGIAAAAFFLYSLRLSDSRPAGGVEPGAAGGHHRRRRLRRVPAPQLPPGPDLHGRCRGAVPRPAAGRHHDRRGGRTADQFSGQTYFFFAPLVIPLVILGVPMLDIVLAVVRRAARRTSIAVPDKDHLHHRLMRLGHGQRRSVLILWAWTAVLSGIVLYPTYTNEGNALVPFGIAALALLLYGVFHPVARKARGDRSAARLAAHERDGPGGAAAEAPAAPDADVALPVEVVLDEDGVVGRRRPRLWSWPRSPIPTASVRPAPTAGPGEREGPVGLEIDPPFGFVPV